MRTPKGYLAGGVKMGGETPTDNSVHLAQPSRPPHQRKPRADVATKPSLVKAGEQQIGDFLHSRRDNLGEGWR